MRQPTFFMAFDYDYTGNPALLDRRKVAFFASSVVSPAVEEQALRWAKACCATDRIVISGFQSPLEKSVFELLLQARHPVIWALGRALYRRYPPAIEKALAEQRILIFAVRNARRTGWQTAQLYHRHNGRGERLRAPHGRTPQLARCPLRAGTGTQTGTLFPAINRRLSRNFPEKPGLNPVLNDQILHLQPPKIGQKRVVLKYDSGD